MTAPLDGILVLDLSRILAGPFCTMMLGDLGARVIKVEHPEGGDVTRGWGPPDDAASGLSAYYLSINRNKESIALDLATAEGVESVVLFALAWGAFPLLTAALFGGSRLHSPLQLRTDQECLGRRAGGSGQLFKGQRREGWLGRN